jgi:lysophospholipase L1-like esterase
MRPPSEKTINNYRIKGKTKAIKQYTLDKKAKGAFMNRLRGILCGIGAAAIMGMGFSGCGEGAIADGDGTGLFAPLVCLGDSLTAGYGAGSPGVEDQTKAYPAYLQSKLVIPVINAGVSGDTTVDALARLDGDVLSQKPRMVIICLGANDFFQAFRQNPNDVFFGTMLSDYRNNLQAIISRLDDGERKIYVAKFYTEAIVREAAGLLGMPEILQTMILSQYDALFASLAASPGAELELIEDIWSGVWGIHMSDQIHPDAQGYELMAGIIFSRIEPYLRTNGLLR